MPYEVQSYLPKERPQFNQKLQEIVYTLVLASMLLQVCYSLLNERKDLLLQFHWYTHTCPWNGISFANCKPSKSDNSLLNTIVVRETSN